MTDPQENPFVANPERTMSAWVNEWKKYLLKGCKAPADLIQRLHALSDAALTIAEGLERMEDEPSN